MKSTQVSSKAIIKEEKRVAEEISSKKKGGFPIVGIGASTGGIETLKELQRFTVVPVAQA